MTRNKHFRSVFAALLCAVLCMTAFATVAYADGGDYYDDELPPETWQEETQPEDNTIVPGTPFTEDGIAATRDLLYDKHTNKQFITVETRNGHTLYIVIDYDKLLDEEEERYQTYAVVLSGMESGKVKGSIYELDYAAKAELAIQTALRTDNNRLIYENGSRELPKEYRFEATPDREYGKFVRYEAVPHDPDTLRDLLRDESRKRERLKPGNFKEHIGRLSDEKVLAEAQRLSAAFQSLQAPNSPNGTHFVVEVSPWFERIASSKEHERLFALLPYKTLYLSSVKDRHGVFAFISKDERRDLPLRKQRPSVRAQLKEGQSKKVAAPKKAAAKAKDNDLEV